MVKSSLKNYKSLKKISNTNIIYYYDCFDILNPKTKIKSLVLVSKKQIYTKTNKRWWISKLPIYYEYKEFHAGDT